MVRADIVCNEQPQFKTDCEILWVKIEITGVHPLFLCAFYRPKEENQDNLIELGKSIEKVKAKAKGNILILVDFNLPKLTWTDNIPTLKPDCSLKPAYETFLDQIDDFSLTQMVTQPTRQGNILDLFLTTNPTLIQQVNCQAGLSDHDMVIAYGALQLKNVNPVKFSFFAKQIGLNSNHL